MNFDRANELWKSLIKANATVLHGESAHHFSPATVLDAVEDAKTPKDMWDSMGIDHSIVVPIKGVVKPGTMLNGTRLCVEKLRDLPDGYDVSIRTPVVPTRWKTYDEELTVIWDNIINSISKGVYKILTGIA